jgi:hypothetical protein
MGLTTGLAKAEAAELARDRRSSGNPSRSELAEARLRFHRVDMVDICELMRETPFIEALSERRLIAGKSTQLSLRS